MKISPYLMVVCSVAASSCAHSQTPLRTLIVSGGPDVETNQYAIESNARYVEKLTSRGVSQRIYFADGRKNSRTISTFVPAPDTKERAILGWLTETDLSGGRLVLRASTLKRLDGPATKKRVLQAAKNLGQGAQANQSGLVYFTGHGSAGEKAGFLGLKQVPDTQNTVHALWNGTLSVRELAPQLQKWPQNAPLVLVMVQCHSGGFANVMFQGGDPKKPLWDGDFCGFFATTGARPSSGCTEDVNERDYQDFTTHFFAALSGVSRDGRKISGVDYDKNGQVSGSEAFAYANIYDFSIDVPVCTSDTFLRHTFGEESEKSLAADWTQTSYSQLLANANPWQKAMLNGLSRELNLRGQNRIEAAINVQRAAKKQTDQQEYKGWYDNETEFSRRFYGLEKKVFARFPGLKLQGNKRERAQKAAIRWLAAQPKEIDFLYRAYMRYSQIAEKVSARESMAERFYRVAHSIVLQKRLETEGTSEQKAGFAKLRAAENRSFLAPG